MPKDLKTRLLIGAGVVALFLVLSLIYGVKKSSEILGEILTGKRAEVPRDKPHEPDDDDHKRKKTDVERPPETPLPPAKAGEYLFCFWNVENLFDDRDDGRKTKADAPYDNFFANDPDALKLKLDRLADVLMVLNDGRGPDLLGIAEVESERAAELLAGVLNKRLGTDAYRVAMKGNPAGRHIATALLTKLPVVKDRTEAWGKRQRILKTVVSVNGHELTLVVSHWTSRLTDSEEMGDKRAGYADAIYGKYKAGYLSALEEKQQLDFLVCGDFNDNPDDVSLTDHLHATGDLARVKAGGKMPLLFDLFAKAYANGEGTHVYRNKKFVFDHVCVSPGMFDDVGWSCDPDTARIVTTFADRKGAPDPFGGPNKKGTRGTSDHFPVTVRLRVR